MKWQDIISTPEFWVVSTIASLAGTLVLSVVANLLTPRVSAFITRNLQARRSGLRERQIKRREQVITLQANVHRRTSAKLDGIFKLLFSTGLVLLCVFLLQLSFDLEKTTGRSTPHFGVSILLFIMLVVGIAIVLGKLGLDDMSLALTADRRERAGDEFIMRRGRVPTDELRQFEDEWDLKTFGVDSQASSSLPDSNRS
jgi:hypothetical protein